MHQGRDTRAWVLGALAALLAGVLAVKGEAQQPPASPFLPERDLLLYDAKNNFVGEYSGPMDPFDALGYVIFRHPPTGIRYKVVLTTTSFFSVHNVYFATPDCTGPAYMILNPYDRDEELVKSSGFGPPGYTVYVPTPGGELFSGTLNSSWYEGSNTCEQIPPYPEPDWEDPYTPIVPAMAIGNFTQHFTPPFTIR